MKATKLINFQNTIKMLFVLSWKGTSRNLNREGGENAFEVGIYPGRFQPLIGRKGYVLNGIDRTFKLPTLRPWLEVKFAGYVGIFDFWVEERTKNKLKKIGVKRIRSIAKFLRHSVSPAFKSIAPHGVIVASKKQ